MIQASRRRFLAIMGVAPAAGKMAAGEAMRMAGIGMPGALTQTGLPFDGALGSIFGAHDEPTSLPIPTSEQKSPWALSKQQRLALLDQALKLPGLRAEVESMLYEDNRLVTYIDHDLAVMRSFSLSAKIVFQRQRNVQRQLDYGVRDNSPYQRLQRWGDRVVKMLMGARAA